SSKIARLLVARDGTLWIGTMKGLAGWRDGKLTLYAELDGQAIYSLLEDHEGTIWAGGFGVSINKFCSIRNAGVQCYEEEGVFRGVLSLYEDSRNNLWAGTTGGVWRWKPGPPKFYPLTGYTGSINGFAEGDNGTLLLGTGTGILKLVDGKYEPFLLPGNVKQFLVYKLFRDRSGSL